MLSGIRIIKGKKKKKKTPLDVQDTEVGDGNKEELKKKNLSAAQRLKAALSSAGADSCVSRNTVGLALSTNDDNQWGGGNKEELESNNLSAAQRLKAALSETGAESFVSQNTVGLDLSTAESDASDGYRGALNSKASYMDRVVGARSNAVVDESSSSNKILVFDGPGSIAAYSKKKEEDMTVEELAAKERLLAGGESWNEEMSRDIIRVGKKRKMKFAGNADYDSDEEVERMKRYLPEYKNAHIESTMSERKAVERAEKMQRNDRRRQIDQYKRQEAITSMCSWWINSQRFARDRLVAFGKHVSLIMARPNASLIAGNQFYLVPHKHAPSMVDCGDDVGVRDEMKRFKTSLENVYAKVGKGIVLCETVLPSKKFWQTRVEAVPVPFSKLQDAPIYFKSALSEQAEEFGTHTKLFRTSTEKPLRAMIPKTFPYFYVEWGNIASSTSTGYAQIIESSNFPRDFGLDTLAGMMGCDPIRFHRKKKYSGSYQKNLLDDFAAKWSSVDWTQSIED